MATITGADPLVLEVINRGNAVVFFDVSLGDTGQSSLGRIKLELFVNDVRVSVKEMKLSYVIFYFFGLTVVHFFEIFLLSCSIHSVPKHVRTFENFVLANTPILTYNR